MRALLLAFPALDGLANILEQHLKPLTIPSITHIRWFQPLTRAVRELPDIPVRDGGIGYSLQKQHPSPLIAGADLMFGPDECLDALVKDALEERRLTRVRLILMLREVHARRLEA